MSNYGDFSKVELSLELDVISVTMWKFKVHFIGGKYMTMLKKCSPLCFLINTHTICPNQFTFLFRIVKAEKYNELSFV